MAELLARRTSKLATLRRVSEEISILNRSFADTSGCDLLGKRQWLTFKTDASGCNFLCLPGNFLRVILIQSGSDSSSHMNEVERIAPEE